MRISILLILILFFGQLDSQIIRTDTNYYLSYDHPKIESIESYNEKNQLEGPWVKYTLEGKVLIQGNYGSGLKEGKWEYFQFNEDLVQKFFHYKNGLLSGSAMIVDTLTIFDVFKKVKSEGNYLNNQKTGTWHYYSKNQNDWENPPYVLDSIVNYENGIRHGEYQSFNLGLKHIKGFYDKGMKQGLWQFYHIFLDSETEETKTLLSHEGEYENNLQQGVWKFYLNDFYQPTYDEAHNAIPFIWNEDNFIELTYKNGLKEGYWVYILKADKGYTIEKGLYKKGLKEKFWTHTNEETTFQAEGNFKKGRKTGVWKETNFDTYYIGEYLNDQKTGIWKEYKNDNLISIGAFKNNQKNGPWEFYHKNEWEDHEFIETTKGVYYQDLPIDTWTIQTFTSKTITEFDVPDGIQLENMAIIQANVKTFNEYNVLRTMSWGSCLLMKIEGFNPPNYLLNPFSGNNNRNNVYDVKQYNELGELASTKKVKDGDYFYDEAPQTYLNEQEFLTSNLNLDSIPNNQFEAYYKNGQLEFKIEERNGIRNGKIQAYYPNGKTLLEGQYVNGIPSGIWNRFYPNSKQQAILDYSTYSKDSIITSKNYDANGVLKNMGTLRLVPLEQNLEYEAEQTDTTLQFLVVKNGFWFEKDSLRTIDQITLFDKIYSHYEYIEDDYDFEEPGFLSSFNMAQSPIVIWKKNSEGLYESKYENGKTSSIGHFNETGPIGTWKFFAREGHLIAEGSYSNTNNQTGKWVLYLNDKKEQKIINYDEKGLLHGQQIDFLSNTKRSFIHGQEQFPNGPYSLETEDGRIEGQYLNNKKIGSWEYHEDYRIRTEEYDSTGLILKKSTTYEDDQTTINEFNYQDSLIISYSIYEEDTTSHSIQNLDQTRIILRWEKFTNSKQLKSKTLNIKEDQFLETTYYKNGNKKSEKLYTSRYNPYVYVDHKTTNFYENGNVQSVEIDGFLHTYWPNGSIKFIENKTDSLYNGVDLTWHYDSTGNIVYIRSFLMYQNFYLVPDGEKWKGFEERDWNWDEALNRFTDYSGYYDDEGNFVDEYNPNNSKPIKYTASGTRDSLMHGFWSYKNGEDGLIAKGNFHQGKQTGKWIEHPGMYNDRYFEAGAYSNGKRTGIWVEIDTEGDTLQIVDFKTPFSAKGVRFSKNGLNISMDCDYVEDHVRSGKVEAEMTLNRLTDADGIYYSPIFDGFVKKYDADHQLEFEFYLKNELPNGPWIQYHQNGKVMEKGAFQNGLKHGEWIYYNSKGEEESKGSYFANMKQGLWLTEYLYEDYYYGYSEEEKPNAIYYVEENYKNNQLDGSWKKLDYHKNPLLTGSYKNGEKEGEWSVFNENKLLTKSHFKDGMKDGKWTDYYAGTDLIKRIAHYENDSIHGSYTEFYKNGKIKSEGNYLNGKKSDVWMYYDLYGQLNQQIDYMEDSKNQLVSPVNLVVPNPFKFQELFAASKNGNYLLVRNGSSFNFWDLNRKKLVKNGFQNEGLSAFWNDGFSNQYDLQKNEVIRLSNHGRYVYNHTIFDLIKEEEIPSDARVMDISPDEKFYLTKKDSLYYNEFGHRQIKTKIAQFELASQKLVSQKLEDQNLINHVQYSKDGQRIIEITRENIKIRSAEDLAILKTIPFDKSLTVNIFRTNNYGYDPSNDFEIHESLEEKIHITEDKVFIFKFKDKSENQYFLNAILTIDLETYDQNEIEFEEDIRLIRFESVCAVNEQILQLMYSIDSSENQVEQRLIKIDLEKKAVIADKKLISRYSVSPFQQYNFKPDPNTYGEIAIPISSIFVAKNKELVFDKSLPFAKLNQDTSYSSGLVWYNLNQDSIVHHHLDDGVLSINFRTLKKAKDSLHFQLFDELDRKVLGNYKINLKQLFQFENRNEKIEEYDPIDSAMIHNLNPIDVEEIFESYYLNQSSFSGIDNGRYVLQVKDDAIRFWNRNHQDILDRTVDCKISKKGDLFFYSPDRYYMGTKGINKALYFEKEFKIFPFEQFDLKYNRPDIILYRLGYADSSLISAYHSAYLKRLKKMGFTENMLKSDFNIPEIKIENFIDLPNITDTNYIDLNLKMEDSKYQLDRINIWINDVAIYGDKGISVKKSKANHLTKKLRLNLSRGSNKIQISVLNQAGVESYKENFDITCTSGKEKPDLYLITIGAGSFEEDSYNLKYAGKDAKDISALFTNSPVFNQVYSKTIVGNQVTNEEIKELEKFLEKSEINDEVIVFIAGHGVLDNNLDYFFASYDMDFQNPKEKGIAYSTIETLLDGIQPLKKILLIDACHSGEIDKDEIELIANTETKEGDIQFRAIQTKASPKLGVKNTSSLTKSLFTDLRKGTGSTVISSAGGMEFAIESEEWQNGLFTYCLLNGIKTKKADLNKDGEIWLKELQEYIQTQVSKLSNGKQVPTSRIENQSMDYRIW